MPGIGELRLPFTRRELMLGLVAFNLIAVGIESYLGHLISGGVKPAEAIPVVFGPLAGLILFAALGAWRLRDMERTAVFTVLGVCMASVVVGVLGTMFHWDRALAPEYLPGDRLRWDWLIYAPPALAPLSFAGIGLLGVVALAEDTSPESGRLTIPGVITFNTPFTKTEHMLWLVALGLWAATVSAFIDHARTEWEDFLVWTPIVIGTFGSVVTTVMALFKGRNRGDFFIFFWTMMLMILLGVAGAGLHINADLPEGTQGGIVWERFVRGAPPIAPMLFANMGLLGIIAMVGAPVTEDAAEVLAEEESEGDG